MTVLALLLRPIFSVDLVFRNTPMRSLVRHNYRHMSLVIPVGIGIGVGTFFVDCGPTANAKGAGRDLASGFSG